MSDAPASYYHDLGRPTWATKAEITKRYAKLSRDRKLQQGADFQHIEQAYETLSDVARRKAYDETLGLASKRKSRADLRPLGFFSKSLSKAQQSWPIWEREFLAVLLTL